MRLRLSLDALPEASEHDWQPVAVTPYEVVADLPKYGHMLQRYRTLHLLNQ